MPLGDWDMLRNRFVFLIGSVLFVTSSFVSAQSQPTESKPSEPVAVFKSSTELVVVPVVVTEKGHHVSGLKKENFLLQENGKDQKIAFLEEVNSSADRMKRVKPPEGTFTNMIETPSSSRRVTIFLLDLLNTKFLDQTTAKDAMVKVLSESIDPREPVALYVLTRSGLRPIHDFTSDPRVLIAAVKKVKGSTQADANADIDADDLGAMEAESQDLADAMGDMAENVNSFTRISSARITLESMRALADAYSGIPGRKSLIWATGSFPFSISDTSMALAPGGRYSISDIAPLYEETWRAINDANFAIYPVDVRGLNASSLVDASRRTTSTSSPMANGRGPRGMGRAPVGGANPNWALNDSLSTLTAFAQATGGKAFYNSNDIERGFREAAQDSSAYYLLSYYLDRTTEKPGWRKLKVKLERKGVSVRARSGFYVPAVGGDPNETRQTDLAAALQSPLDFTQVPVKLILTKVTPAAEAGKMNVDYDVVIPPNAVTIDEAANNHVKVEFIALVREADGKVAMPPDGRTLEAHLKPDVLSQVKANGMRYHSQLVMPSGEYLIRFVARDFLSGKVGSLSAAVNVPVANASGK
jgi:VWFA-related protein